VNKLVLVVDDDADIQETIGIILESRGFEFAVANDGAHALEQLQADRLPAVILLDLMMPGMSGPEFRTEQLKDPRLASLPVVVMTGDTRGQTKASELGVTRIIRKPFSIDDVLEAIREVIT